MLYRDDKIACDDEGVTIGSYYFPFGGEKRVPYRAIRRIATWKMGFLTGKGRIWDGDFRHWLNLDWSRPGKETAILLDLGGWWRPVITPDRPDEVLAILEEKTGKKREPA